MKIAEAQSDRLVHVSHALLDRQYDYAIREDEAVGFVFPVYAWAAPSAVIEFIDKINLDFRGTPYTYVLCTCGDDSGLTRESIEKVLNRNGIDMYAFFSVVMPNNYIIGFEVDSEELQNKKIANAENELIEINQHISNKNHIIIDNYRGKFSFIKSRIINPMFNTFMTNDKSFKVNNRCTGCKTCEKVCPNGNISTSGKKVEWHGNCSMCLACVNFCPFQAIEYGKSTQNKKRYTRFKHLMIESKK